MLLQSTARFCCSKDTRDTAIASYRTRKLLVESVASFFCNTGTGLTSITIYKIGSLFCTASRCRTL